MNTRLVSAEFFQVHPLTAYCSTRCSVSAEKNHQRRIFYESRSLIWPDRHPNGIRFGRRHKGTPVCPSRLVSGLGGPGQFACDKQDGG